MLNDPDAVRVAAALRDCFATIARCEQDLHAARRQKCMGNADEVGDLVNALKTDCAKIDDQLEEATDIDAILSDAPTMTVDVLLSTLGELPTPASAYPTNPDEIPKWISSFIVKAQLLDGWLEPANNTDMTLSKEQAEFRDIFDTNGYLQLTDGALLIRRRITRWQGDDDEVETFGLFARYLREVTYIPALLDCDDPDILKYTGNPISSGFYLWNSDTILSNPLPTDPKIAVAPLAERGSDVAFVPSACRSKYALNLNYDESRFAAALARALNENVNILLIPEMALPEGDPSDFADRMRKLFLEVRATHYNQSGEVGQLCFVIAGVLGGAGPDGHHRNYAVAFDAYGEQPEGFQQLKLSHWNITRSEQDRFGITHYQAKNGDLADPIVENSLPAECLSILEIPGVGRTATLICADMSQNNPGDWLSLNAVLDWIYAPIMDKSTCWEISDQQNTPRPWIVNRSYRAALLTRTVVITTNSMSLSRWVNEANKLSKSTWPQYSEVGIGLAINGRVDVPTQCHVSTPIDETNVLMAFAPMNQWPPFPLPPNNQK